MLGFQSYALQVPTVYSPRGQETVASSKVLLDKYIDVFFLSLHAAHYYPPPVDALLWTLTLLPLAMSHGHMRPLHVCSCIHIGTDPSRKKAKLMSFHGIFSAGFD